MKRNVKRKSVNRRRMKERQYFSFWGVKIKIIAVNWKKELKLVPENLFVCMFV